MTDTNVQSDAGEKQAESQESKQDKTFTQAEVDRIVKDRAERIAKQQYADYDDLKAKAEGAKTLEEQLSELKQDLTSTKTEALRARVAAKFGVSTEPGEDGKSDTDLFLTGTDEDTLTAQAKRLAARVSERKKTGNIAPREGNTTNSGKPDPKREWLRSLKE